MDKKVYHILHGKPVLYYIYIQILKKMPVWTGKCRCTGNYADAVQL